MTVLPPAGHPEGEFSIVPKWTETGEIVKDVFPARCISIPLMWPSVANDH